jgi:hypothetical protein
MVPGANMNEDDRVRRELARTPPFHQQSPDETKRDSSSVDARQSDGELSDEELSRVSAGASSIGAQVSPSQTKVKVVP